MRNWVTGSPQLRRWLAASALLFLWLPTSIALSQASAATNEEVAIAAEALPPAVAGLLDEGRSLEAAGRWGDALAHYEEALRQFPGDVALKNRFDTARLYYSLDQRYSDQSFRQSIRELNAREALDLYSDLLDKIETHYVTTPPWREIALRGDRAVEIALANRDFLSANSVRVEQKKLVQLQRDLDNVVSRSSIRSRRDAIAVAAEAARLAAYRVGLNQSATILEFTAAAAGGLDHYSAFLTSDQLHDVYSQIDGNFVGLGVELKADDGALLIVDVITGSPAKKAGIVPGDRIVAVDGQRTADLSTDEAASLLTGQEGTIVRLTVESVGRAPRVVSVRREHVEVPALEDVQIIDGKSGVAYLRIPAFQKNTARDLESALWDLHRQGMRSLIIDLRGNPGGLLSSSVEVADKFIAQGPIVLTHGRNPQEEFNYRAHRVGTWRVPLVVLIDGDSASASEIFAGAIRDSKRGTIIGEQSYGKGSVQGIFPLAYGGTGIRLTTAKFFSPDGHPISMVGVKPHIDARRATMVADGATNSAQEEHLVGYRGPTSVATDGVLRLAIETARKQRPAVL